MLKNIIMFNGEFYYEYLDKITHELFIDRLCVLKVDWNNLLTDDNGIVVLGIMVIIPSQ